MTLKQYQERVAEFPAVIGGEKPTLELCVLGLISGTGRLQTLAQRKAVDPVTSVSHQSNTEATELSGELLWLLALACKEFGVDLETAAEHHLQRLAEAAKRHLG